MTPTTISAPPQGETRKGKSPITTSSYQVPTASLVLDLPMYHRQIPELRKAICSIIDQDRQTTGILSEAERMLFHNHDPDSPDGRLHAPAQIHYRIRKRTLKGGREQEHQAWLYGIGKGAIAIQKLLAILPQNKIYIGARDCQPTVQGFRADQYDIQHSPAPQRYCLRYWIALSPHVFKNYWLTAPDFHAKARILEERLNLHIQNFAKGIGWEFPADAKATLQDFSAKHTVKVWGEKLIAFDIDYDFPYTLPPAIALGRAVSHGYGVQQ